MASLSGIKDRRLFSLIFGWLLKRDESRRYRYRPCSFGSRARLRPSPVPLPASSLVIERAILTLERSGMGPCSLPRKRGVYLVECFMSLDGPTIRTLRPPRGFRLCRLCLHRVPFRFFVPRRGHGLVPWNRETIVTRSLFTLLSSIFNESVHGPSFYNF